MGGKPWFFHVFLRLSWPVFTEKLNEITAVEAMFWIIEMILGSVDQRPSYRYVVQLHAGTLIFHINFPYGTLLSERFWYLVYWSVDGELNRKFPLVCESGCIIHQGVFGGFGNQMIPNWCEHHEVYRQIGSFFMCMNTYVFLGMCWQTWGKLIQSCSAQTLIVCRDSDYGTLKGHSDKQPLTFIPIHPMVPKQFQWIKKHRKLALCQTYFGDTFPSKRTKYRKQLLAIDLHDQWRSPSITGSQQHQRPLQFKGLFQHVGWNMASSKAKFTRRFVEKMH